MTNRHIAFIVESAHGHINPTLGITSKLIEYGYRVSYAVSDYFAARVLAIGAEALIYKPMQTKLWLFREMQEDKDGSFPFDFERANLTKFDSWFDQETADTRSQLEALYQQDRPDLIIYDVMTLAARHIAKAWNIATAEHCPMRLDDSYTDYDSHLVIVSMPNFFWKDSKKLDGRFHFVGPIYNDGRFFQPWISEEQNEQTILVSATTGLLPQIEFFHTATRALEKLPFRIILSIGSDLDPASLGPLPPNFRINQFSSQQKILEQCCLFIGQGGPSSIFEALRWGVPPILIPPSQYHDIQARRVEELGLGIRLLKADFSAENLKNCVVSLLHNRVITERVKRVQKILSKMNGAEKAASLIDRYLRALKTS